ncbi:MAG: hypothetical protein HQ592_13895 [Planctomycetes bacterium]|nr:hypothetical protein [Planctomycetota bacterium]
MARTGKPGIFTKLMAAGCSICPFCIPSRIWPNSTFARKMQCLERICPWCRAYNRLHGPRPGADDEDEAQATA